MFRSAIQKGKFESKITLFIMIGILGFLIITDLGVFAKSNDEEGYGWFPVVNPPVDEFTDVFVASETSIWITSTSGKVYHSTQVNSSYGISHDASVKLNAIAAVENYIIVVGNNGYIAYKANTSNWFAPVNKPTVENLLAVEVQLPHIWAVGENAVILHSNNSGISWELQSPPVNVEFRGVGFMNSTNGWIVGEQGKIISTKSSGNIWVSENSGTTTNFNDIDVDVSSSPRIWIVGDDGLFMISWGPGYGTIFTSMETGTQKNLYSVYSPFYGVIWAAGEDYTIVGSAKQGTEFETQVLDTSKIDGSGNFYGIGIVNDTGIAVGSSIFYTQTGGGLIPKFEVEDDWQDIGFYSRNVIPRLLEGMVNAVKVVIIALTIGFFLGLVMATFRTVRNKALNIFATAYSDLFRNTPLLVQLTFIAFGLPELGFNPPLFWDAVIALSLNTGAYQSEIIRSGILAIPKGQMEAARSLGMSNTQAMRYVILPQAIRITIPPLSNESVNMFLNSSLLSTIGFEDIMRVGAIVAAQSFLWARTFLYVGATYFIVTYSITRILRKIEKKLKIPGLGGGAI